MQRFDYFKFKAEKTKEGFIRDKPVIARAGLLKYLNADGTERIEYRPPEEAFDEESLASIMGKPITLGHPGMVSANNAKDMPIIGAAISKGYQDGQTIRADISLFQLPTGSRELSCGYTLDLDETPGTTPDGQHYDAIQRNVRVNHIAIVNKARAGSIARLNMDGEQVVESEQEDKNMESNKNMTKIRLDGGLEYEAAPEVGVYVDKLRKENEKLHNDAAEAEKTAKKSYDELQAKYDAANADIEKLKEEAKKAADEAKANFDSAVKARVSLLDIAGKHKIEKADGMTDKEIKLAVIKAVRGEKVNLDGKSDDYIEAAFDMAKDEVQAREDGMASQRQQITNPKAQENNNTNNQHADEDDPQAALDELMKAEANFYAQEDK